MRRYLLSCAHLPRLHGHTAALTFSSVLSRSFLLKESTQSLKHRSTSELYILKLQQRGDEVSNPALAAGAEGSRNCGPPISHLHLLDPGQQIVFLLFWQVCQPIQGTSHAHGGATAGPAPGRGKLVSPSASVTSCCDERVGDQDAMPAVAGLDASWTTYTHPPVGHKGRVGPYMLDHQLNFQGR